MFGIINLFKPAGITSRDAVTKVVRAIDQKQAGHAGTLDPIAEGVLLIAVGRATKLVPYLQELPKRYVATFQLGLRSNTQDISGICEAVPWQTFTQGDVETIAREFTGSILQAPPIFSAVRVAGRRAYKLGRKGRVVEIPPRPVEVHAIKILDVSPPFWTMEIECGKGTYVRTLGHEIGEKLGSAATMTTLRRTAIGHFDVEKAVSIEDVKKKSVSEFLHEPLVVVDHWPKVFLTEEQEHDVAFGRHPEVPGTPPRAAVVDSKGRLASIMELTESGNYRFVVNFIGK